MEGCTHGAFMDTPLARYVKEAPHEVRFNEAMSWPRENGLVPTVPSLSPRCSFDSLNDESLTSKEEY